MNTQYKNTSNRLITAQQAELEGSHYKEYLQDGFVKIIEDRLYSEIESIIYYKDPEETDDEIFAKYKNISTINAIRIKKRDHQTQTPYIIETEEIFLRDGDIFINQLLTIKELIDPSGRIGSWEVFNKELPSTDPEYRSVGKIFYFGSRDDDFDYEIPSLTTNYTGYGNLFEESRFDPGLSGDEQDVELFDRNETIAHLSNYPQEIIEWFLSDEFLPPSSF
ncbi:hypothetical protein AAFH68_08480 [Flavobacterium sp. CGRL1]